MKLTRKELIIVVILALLTALEALSIDLYLPAFQAISEDLKTDIGKVQISLSVFLGGFAVGQLLWGPLSDRFGRKWPLVIAITIYTISSVLVIAVSSIEELWLCRFMQAFSGSAGVVIARAVVTDIFDKKRTTSIFALLAMIIGVAPIIAPSIGNLLLEHGDWHNVFIAMTMLGAVAFLSVIFFLPETLKKTQTESAKTLCGWLIPSCVPQ
jgi:DHA1 family bicyclomycin/chloramphenicol resistance-like MFS transporter